MNLEKPEFISVEVKNDKVVERAPNELISSSLNYAVSKRLVVFIRISNLIYVAATKERPGQQCWPGPGFMQCFILYLEYIA